MIRAVIIDDEIKSILLLRKLLNDHCKNIEIAGEAKNIKEGFAIISEKRPQLLFLDIEMGDGTGFDLVKQFDSPSFSIIFITAHSNYAVTAFKYSAVDYVLKPIDIDDLVHAVEKAASLIAKNESEVKSLEFLNIRTGKGKIYLKPADIIHIQAESSYSRIFVNDGHSYVVSGNLGAVESRLDSEMFLRVHKSAIINLNYLKKFHDSESSFTEMQDGTIVPVSRRSKDVLRKKLSTN